MEMKEKGINSFKKEHQNQQQQTKLQTENNAMKKMVHNLLYAFNKDFNKSNNDTKYFTK